MSQILDGDGTKIYAIEDRILAQLYIETMAEFIEYNEHEIFDKYFTDTDNSIWNETFYDPDNFYVGFSVIEGGIVPRMYKYSNTKKFVPVLYDKTCELIKPKFREELHNKNIEFVFDKFTFMKLDELEDFGFGEEDANTLRKIALVGEHLETNDTLRGAASIADTGLFDFKIK